MERTNQLVAPTELERPLTDAELDLAAGGAVAFRLDFNRANTFDESPFVDVVPPKFWGPR